MLSTRYCRVMSVALGRRDVEQIFRLINTRDLQALTTFLHPDLEFHSVFSAVEGGAVYRGVDGVQQLFAALDAVWDALRWELDDVRTTETQSVVIYRVVGRAKESGVPMEQTVAMLWTVQDGKVRSSRTFLHPRDALEAAGLSESEK